MKKKLYKLKSELWIYPTEAAAWHFVTVDKKEAKEIKENFGAHARGFRSLPVEVKIGKTAWKTSIFPAKDGTYLLPVKAQVRKAEGLFAGNRVSFAIKIL